MLLNNVLFFDEATDQIEIIRTGLVSLENDLHNLDTINNIFRAAHTLKGSADIYDFKDIVNLVHKIENLLDEIRNKNILMSENIRQLLFNAKDIVETLVELKAANKTIDQFTSLLIISLENELNVQLTSNTQPTILMIDKDSTVRDLAKFTAQEAGYTIVTADNCTNAMQTLKHTNFDLIFSDLTIINPHKIEMLKTIKKLDQYKFTPIVVLINQRDEIINSQSKSLGVTAWLKKPFDKTSFLTAIEKLI